MVTLSSPLGLSRKASGAPLGSGRAMTSQDDCPDELGVLLPVNSVLVPEFLEISASLELNFDNGGSCLYLLDIGGTNGRQHASRVHKSH